MKKAKSSCEFDSGKLEWRRHLLMDGHKDAIGPAVESLMEIMRQTGCIEGKEIEVETALREALANAVIHGAKENPEKKVECWVACDQEKGLLIIVRDPGEGFNPDKVPSPLHGENVFSTHGRGIYLINQLMDEVHFERGGTEIRMIKR